MSQQAIRNAKQLGIRARPILNPNAQVPVFRTHDEFSRWRDSAIRKMEQGDSADYYAWVQGEAAGIWDNLANTAQMNGALPISPEEMAREVVEQQQRDQRFFRPESVHPLLRELGLEHEDSIALRDRLSVAMIDAAPEMRPELMKVIDAVDRSPTSSFMSVEWTMGDQPLIVEANSGSPQVQSEQNTLNSLAIKRSVAEDAVWSGITDWSGSGGTYEVWSDSHLQQQIAQNNNNGAEDGAQ